VLIALAVFMASSVASASSNLVDYVDKANGFTLQYPDYWTVVKDADTMIAAQAGSLDLINAEGLSSAEKDSYKVMIHVDGKPRYLSNVLVLVRPFGSPYSSAENAVQAVKLDFEKNMASGTYFLEDSYLGESHAYTYRKSMGVPQWNDSIRVTYYLTAGKSRAYMMIETVMASALNDAVYRDQFNQVLQSFRATDNETTPIDPSLDWGSAKPGAVPPPSGPGNTEVGQIEIHENFDNNSFNWPTGPNASIKDGRYILDSRNAYPFTVRNTGLGQISFDFSYQGDVEFLDGSDSAGYGLVFAYTDADNYYAFLITKGGQFMVVQEQNGQVRNIIPWTPTAALSGTKHTLSIQGDYQTLNEGALTHRYTIAFNIDGAEVARTDINDVLGVSGWFGLFVSEGVEVGYDSLVARNFLQGGVATLERNPPQ
jgi:hypothetical protein